MISYNEKEIGQPEEWYECPAPEIWSKKPAEQIKWNRSLVYEIKYLVYFNNRHISTLMESDLEIDENYINGNVHNNCIRILNNLKLLLKGSEGEEKLKLIKTITALASIQMDNM